MKICCNHVIHFIIEKLELLQDICGLCFHIWWLWKTYFHSYIFKFKPNLAKGLFILTLHYVAMPIYRLLFAWSHHSITAFQVKMNLNFMQHRNAVTSQYLCRRVKSGNAMQLEMLLIPNALCWSSRKCNLRLHVTRRSATALARYPQKLAKIVCG